MRPKALMLIAVLIPILFIIVPRPAFSDYQLILTPSLSVSEVYDDNIFLNPNDDLAQSDYITSVTPGIALDVQTPRHWLLLSYAPSFVWYHRNSDNDTVRHFGSIAYHQEVTPNWRFDFKDTYVRSEDPFETTPGIETPRTGEEERNPYQRNDAEVKLSYLFGPENIFAVGYRNSLLINEAETVDDGAIHEPFVDYVQWFDNKNGMGLGFRYTIGTYESGSVQPEYTGYSPILRYLRRFDPQAIGYVSYTYTERDFDPGFRRDYTIHTGRVGLDKQFSPRTALNAGLGYFIQEEDGAGSESGPAYHLYLRKNYQRGNFVIGGAGGWDEQYLEAENRGFVEFYSVEGSGEYIFLETLNGYASGIYRQDMYMNNDVEDKTWRGTVGLRWIVHRYVSVLLDYTHVSRTSDLPENEYDDNRYMLVLTGSKPFFWR
jgi:hypothetical protein